MTSTLDTSPGPVQRQRTRRFVTQFVLAFLAYGIVLTASLIWGDWESENPWRVVWALAPMLPIIAVAAILIRWVATADEYEVIQSCKSLAVAFAVTMLTATTIGFLGFTGIDVLGAGWWIYSIGMFTWLVARISLDVRDGRRADG